MIKANLVHLSFNMWRDRSYGTSDSPQSKDVFYEPHLRFDEQVWREVITHMAQVGMNMVILDLGDAVAYNSHPEIAIDGAWSTKKLRQELEFCRSYGIEPVPKLNFSACHDVWLGEYSHKLATHEYYAVCADLIREVAEIFGGPRFFHIGMDEETWQHQRDMLYVVIRQGDLWWHDLNFLVEEVETAGSRAWMWSDVIWNCDRNIFQTNVPRTVLQSNWYYDVTFPLPEDDPHNYVRAYHWLDEMGYDQVPTGSTWSHQENYALTVDYCLQHLSEQLLLGFMMTTWHPTTEVWRQTHIDAIRAVEVTSHTATSDA